MFIFDIIIFTDFDIFYDLLKLLIPVELIVDTHDVDK